MSWDIVLFNSRQTIKSIEDIDENQLESTNFCSVLENQYDRIVRDDNHRTIVGDDFQIDFFMDNERVSNKIMHLYGEKGLYEVVALAKENGWQIFDTGLEQMIDLDNPEKNGYENFNNYAKHILSDHERIKNNK